MYKPREIHWKIALRILTYIKGFPYKGLLYKKTWTSVNSTDSNYAGDKKSTFAHCTYVGGNMVSWRSKK